MRCHVLNPRTARYDMCISTLMGRVRRKKNGGGKSTTQLSACDAFQQKHAYGVHTLPHTVLRTHHIIGETVANHPFRTFQDPGQPGSGAGRGGSRTVSLSCFSPPPVHVENSQRKGGFSDDPGSVNSQPNHHAICYGLDVCYQSPRICGPPGLVDCSSSCVGLQTQK